LTHKHKVSALAWCRVSRVKSEPNWDDWRLFLLAAQAGTLAGAARAAGVQHSTVGRRLSKLEKTLGAALFLRTPEGLTLTTLGQQVLPQAQNIQHATQALRELLTTRSQRVRVALPSGFIGVFADLLAQFALDHPNVALETISGSQTLDLSSGEADLALRIGPVQDPDLIARPLGEVGSSLYAAPSYLAKHPVQKPLKSLSGHKLIGFSAPLANMPAARWLSEHAQGTTTVLRTNEISTMLEAAASGSGIAMLPCFLARADTRLQRLSPQVLATRGLSLVYRREHRHSPALKAVAGFLTQAIKDRAARVRGDGG
jgi:DNA-binding transcriptional LysR family regulator